MKPAQRRLRGAASVALGEGKLRRPRHLIWLKASRAVGPEDRGPAVLESCRQFLHMPTAAVFRSTETETALVTVEAPISTRIVASSARSIASRPSGLSKASRRAGIDVPSSDAATKCLFSYPLNGQIVATAIDSRLQPQPSRVEAHAPRMVARLRARERYAMAVGGFGHSWRLQRFVAAREDRVEAGFGAMTRQFAADCDLDLACFVH